MVLGGVLYCGNKTDARAWGPHSAQRFEEVNERLERIENTMARLVTALEAANLRSPPASTSTSPSSTSAVAARARARTRSVEMPSARSKNQLVANKQGDIQYLGPSSLLSFTSEAETLVEERLRASGGESNGTGSRSEQSETIGALRRLSVISSKSVNFFPHYGHMELRTGAEGAVMGMPPREETDMLVDGSSVSGCGGGGGCGWVGNGGNR